MRRHGVAPASKNKACKGCGAPIVWAVTERGERMPVDAQLELGGNLVLCYEVDELERPIGAQLVVSAADGYVGPRWVSHFATCPRASMFRRSDARRGVP